MPAARQPRRTRNGLAGRARRSPALAAARKVAVAAVGSTVVGVGVALVVLPGPAILVIPAGLAILATEFAWARRLLRVGKERVGQVVARGRSRREAGRRPSSRTSR